MIEPSPADATFLGVDLDDDDLLGGTVVVTHRLTSPRGTFYGGAGLALACMMMEHATGRATVWCTVQFVQSAAHGDRLDLRTEVVAHGHRTSQARVVARVDGREMFSGFGATGASSARVTKTFSAMPAVSPVDDSPPVQWLFGADPATTNFGSTEVREAVVHGGSEGGASPTVALWARVDGSPPWSPALLAFVADIVPMSVHRALGSQHPGARSLDNSLRVGPSVDTEWVLLALYPEAVHDGFGHGSVHLWAPGGTLMGMASQTFALTSPPPR